MARSVKPPHDPYDAHLKRLLDQRALRADIHGHPPSPSPSSQYDASSIYSPSILSPRPQRNRSDRKPPTYNSQRLNDPASSILDLDDDGHSSCDSSNPDDVDESIGDRLDDDDDDQPQLRMSMLGPKMRFHSRAPWETGEDTLEEEEESDNSAHHIGGGLRPKISGERLPKAGSTKISFGRASSKSRSGSGGRPSNESARSGQKSQRSFDTTSSYISVPMGSPPPLPLGPTSNLSSPSPHPSHHITRNNILATHGRSATPSLASLSSNAPSPNPSPSAEDFRFSTASSIPWVSAGVQATYAATSSSASYQQDEEMHPYANPDFAVSYTEISPVPSPLRPELAPPTVFRSNSSTTVTNSPATGSSRSAAATFTPDNSTSSIEPHSREEKPRSRASTFQGKEISSPMSFHKPGLRNAEGFVNPWNHEPKLAIPQTSALPGLSNPTPGFTLISLEEARAQRSRSATAKAATPTSTSIVDFPSRVAPSPKDVLDRPHGTTTMSGRIRSTSAGARARNALHSIVGGSAVEGPEYTTLSRPPSPSGSIVHGKALKHKRSGFLRMFNAKEKEKDREKDIPPPVPQLSDSYAAQFPVRTIDHVADCIPASQTLKVPDNSSAVGSRPTLFSNYSNSGSSGLEHKPAATMQKPSGSPKRPMPLLSINTSSHSPTRPPLSATASEALHSHRAEPPSISSQENNIPQSAPANVFDFPALKLRPVSTMFSAHFREHFIKSDSESEADTETHSPASSGHGTIPVTPSSFARSDPASIGRSRVNSDDPSSVIKALQHQIASSRKAWQLEVWDLEGQVRDLKAELEDMRAAEKEYCGACGRGSPTRGELHDMTKKSGVVNRPRARTGASSRFGNAN